MLVWGLAAGLVGLSACQTRKKETCASVQALVLEELRVTDGFRDRQHDSHSLALNASQLEELSSRVKSLEVRDAELREAVRRYGADLDVLARAYAHHARARARPALEPAESDDGHVGPGLSLATHEGVVNEARSAVSRLCALP
ncbi:hypothetical protein [Myxococcus sp. CA040A]|uniref:hypothetical protein n=1 Tax=Myxococcus sp. CA040A TaxID=2741738 RepID=UPI00157B8FDA|nr:hypothetical protein [Myxococcus sp. CA040A]NTX05699.1 hypothetical protein [Myxococcus sp. CA040A]